MEKVYMVVNETDRSDGVFTSPEKAVAWYYKDELLELDNTIKMWDGEIVPFEKEVKRMRDRFGDFPYLATLEIDSDKTELVDG